MATANSTAPSALQLNIELNGEMFQNAPHEEVSRILREASVQIKLHGLDAIHNFPLRDLRGNTVGRITLRK